MITSKQPITLAEVKEIVTKKSKEQEDNERTKLLKELLSKVVKIKPEEARKLKQEIKDLNIIKLNEVDIIKLVDFMPEDAEDIRKIFAGQGINLDENEINSILTTFKKYK